jgi:diadenosine tetraphosphatase ApaH/serine/threonine PP2A family protein phosphatase
MKKLALLADLHSNLEAVTACLAHAERAGADAFAFLGDLVGYGADPGPVLDLVMERVRQGALVVRGNHDDAALDERGAEGMNSAADEAAAWTRRQLSAAHREFLSGLPFVVRRDDMLLVHGSAAAPEKHVYVTEPRSAAFSLAAAGDAAYVFCGHVHEPVLYYTGAGSRPLPFRPVPGVAIPAPSRKRWLAVVGSAGQPRDGNTAACYAILDRERATITFHRIPYDWARAADKIRAAGLPERLAVRLSRGE